MIGDFPPESTKFNIIFYDKKKYIIKFHFLYFFNRPKNYNVLILLLYTLKDNMNISETII